MNIKPSTALRNEYAKISSLAHKSREPIFITKNGEGDLVIQSLEVYE
jgi:PHD/YefM family antitoxin component YafN of YafNO toxin-antitoxin module